MIVWQCIIHSFYFSDSLMFYHYNIYLVRGMLPELVTSLGVVCSDRRGLLHYKNLQVLPFQIHKLRFKTFQSHLVLTKPPARSDASNAVRLGVYNPGVMTGENITGNTQRHCAPNIKCRLIDAKIN